MYVILVYDLSQERNGAKTQRWVFKICKKYLTHVQFSVFEGELSQSQLEALKAELRPFVRDDLDSIIIFKNQNKNWLKKEYIGQDREDLTSNIF
ncbi:CRISPR-associated endonuclease Cas2 [Agrilactobacillus fermenti]|uniref:CRISPR-associated endonuclease Cas2 n=1 Tax=Agrilactobacillus fermenti TaxID=2586909 RepID=UPI001E4DAA32|nr:CRISPR-associated endonuclease Cas2 [Agrilactobacillus fermenti]MCD2257196.1 CRISPR-associated endonuclease Cas2 [Agrilactobacillus fermenti]